MIRRFARIPTVVLFALGMTAIAWSATAAESKDELRKQAYDTSLPVGKRMDAVRELTGKKFDGSKTYRICVWDMFGKVGPIYAAAKEQQATITAYGLKTEMIPHTSESVMVEELKAGTCDAALMSGLRARLFNEYTGTLDAIGGLYDLDQVRLAHKLLADPRSADKMVENGYVIMGIAGGTAAYIFVNDRSINTLQAAAGKRVAVLDYDPVQSEMIAGIGATPVVTDIVNAPNMFNNGVVDVLAAPLAGYEVLELYKGMSPNGGIIDLPLTYVSLQLVGHESIFPNELAQLIREAFYSNFDAMLARIFAEEEKVPEKWWIEIPAEDRVRYEKRMQEARLVLRDEKNYYDPEMLTLLRKIRCRSDASRPECTNPVE